MPFGVSEIYQEGLQVPPVRMFQGGELQRDLWALVAQNVRTRHEVRGDLEAQYAAQRRRRPEPYPDVRPIRRRHGGTISRGDAGLLGAPHACASEDDPEGVYEFEDVLEGDGIVDRTYTIRLKMEAHADGLLLDFSDTR